MSENLLLKDCLDAFLKNLEDDESFPKDLTAQLKDLRKNGKLTKGDHMKLAIANYVPPKK